MTVQIIEKRTGYKYDNIYGTMLNEARDQIGVSVMKGFFDDHGWFLTEYPTEFPGWNGVISDSQDVRLLNDPSMFEKCRSRGHAESLLMSYALKAFEEQLKDILKLPKETLILHRTDLDKSAAEKELESVIYSDLNFDSSGLALHSDTVVVRHGNRAMVLKSKSELPFIGMIVTI